MTEQVGDPLRILAAAAGLVPVWEDVFSQTHEVGDDSLRSLLSALGFPCNTLAQIQDSHRRVLAASAPEPASASDRLWVIDTGQILDFPWQGDISSQLVLESGQCIGGVTVWREPGVVRLAPIFEPGYHHLYIGNARIALAVCPPRCPAPSRGNGGGAPAWGIAAQVYSLHGEQPGNRAGDFSVLADFAARAGHAGASAVAISPVHALFTAAPERYSPYSPSSRLFLNVAYADPSLIDGLDATTAGMNTEAGHATMSAGHAGDAVSTGPGFDDEMGALAINDAGIINWPAHMRAHLALLRQCFNQFDRGADQPLAQEFRRFCLAGGEALESHARYEALSALYCRSLGPESGWQDWPVSLHDPEGAAAGRFAAEHRNDVDFHCFLQWLADKGLAAAQAAALEGGMSVGLITDLAIGTDARGSHAWSRQREILHKASVGAPPDRYQPQGQSWGITAFSPHALQSNGYMGFIETLRANLRHAGGIRMDHIMGLARMWLVPDGASAREGVYLRYPFRDMLRLLVLEAWRHNAIVIGENLGTVAPDFNAHLKEKGILGTSVLWFEEQGTWPDWTMATTSTHDLPTIEGWWTARDVCWREQLGQYTLQQAEQQRTDRNAEKAALLATLPPNEVAPDTVAAPRQAILKHVAATPGPLVIIPLEDILGLLEQPNLPGTSTGPGAKGDGHPSWTQRIPQPVEALFNDSENQRSLQSIRQGRDVAARNAAAPSSASATGLDLDVSRDEGADSGTFQDGA